MWRFIMITFAFLGWAFYELSGGADYKPRLQSIQARAQLDDVRPVARPEPVAVTQLAVEEPAQVDDAVSRALSSLDDMDLTDGKRFKVTLASAGGEVAAQPAFAADGPKTDMLTQTPEIDPASAPEPAVVAVAAAADPVRDIRQVTGSVVNMRDGPSTFYLAIGRLRQGDEVEVLDTSADGWLKIRVVETEQEGWMADWLATAAAN